MLLEAAWRMDHGQDIWPGCGTNGVRCAVCGTASWSLPSPMPTLEVLTASSVTLPSEDWTAEREVLTQPGFCQF